MNREPDNVDLTPDAVAPAASDADESIAVAGILGESADDSLVRIYLDAGFSTFYDIPKDAIADRQRVQAAESPFGVASTVLRVRQGTRITAQHSSARTIDHEFLAGDFTAPGTFRALTWSAPSPPQGMAGRYNKFTDDRWPTKANICGTIPACPD